MLTFLDHQNVDDMWLYSGSIAKIRRANRDNFSQSEAFHCILLIDYLAVGKPWRLPIANEKEPNITQIKLEHLKASVAWDGLSYFMNDDSQHVYRILY